MIIKISINQLKIGMYVNDLNYVWQKHPFAWQCFTIEDAATLNKILGSGIAEIYIDTSRGADVDAVEAGTVEAEEPLCEPSAILPDIISRISPVEEFRRAKELYSNANKLMQGLMKDVRLGKQIELEQCEPIIDSIIGSMFRSPSALLPLAQMKTVDEYTFQHSVSVAALAVAFGRVMDMPHDEIKALALGGLLHDVGKAKVPTSILNKSGKLDDAEFAVMKRHVSNTAALLKDAKGINEITFNAATQHHERYDGTGYPHGLKSDQISLHGQMLAIVDVYDAITSIRVYHKGMPPTEALRKMFEWGGAHFNAKLVQAFIKGIGIYPAGSLVRMESERLGIVREVVPDKLLQPVVQLIYDCKKMCYIPPERVELSASNDKIKSHESFEKWKISQAEWAMAEA
ncbi:MAG: HD-GYP domain-containing protein [Gallionella sp.]|nr:HD-GYP domain-containing protein [Gallionella sp.]